MLRKRSGGSPQQLVAIPLKTIVPRDWSADGRYVAVDRYRDNPDAAVWSIEERSWIDIATTDAAEGASVFSPDGKWIAYHSAESGRLEVYVQPFPPTGAKYQVSTAGGKLPHWPKAGEIIWLDLNNRLHAVAVSTTSEFRSGDPVPLFDVDQRENFVAQFDVAPDDTFIINAPVRQKAKPMRLVINWQQRID